MDGESIQALRDRTVVRAGELGHNRDKKATWTPFNTTRAEHCSIK